MKKALTLLLAVSCYSNAEVIPEGCDIEQQKDLIATMLGHVEFCGLRDYSHTMENIEKMLQADQKSCKITPEQQQPTPAQISQKIQTLNQRMPHPFSPQEILKGAFGMQSRPAQDKQSFCNSVKSEIDNMFSNPSAAPQPIAQEQPSREDQEKAAYTEYLGFIPEKRHSNCIFFAAQTAAMQKEFQSAFYGRKSLNEALYYAKQRAEMSAPPPYHIRHIRLSAMSHIQQTIFSGMASDAELMRYRVFFHNECISIIQKMAEDIRREQNSIQNRPYDYSQR